MEISGTSAASSASAAKSVTKTASQELGQTQFMQLLLAQMQNQDPLEPMKDADFIAQLAQFESLNALTAMSKTLEQLAQNQNLAQGSALIGKTVNGITTAGSVITGVVTSVQSISGKITLEVDGERMDIGNVRSVTQTEGSKDNGGQTESDTSYTAG